jgi:mevalonate kinase
MGAKLSGAGGGDCMLAVVNMDVKNEVEDSIEKVGGKVMHITMNAEGVRIESN